jgi:nicotinate-nucleotide adenylyltransferase
MKPLANGIGLFGGTFDPVHIGHLIIAEWLTEVLEIETTYFIPTKIHPFDKRSDISPAKTRIKMLEIAIEGYQKFEISDYELNTNKVSYSVDTIHFFKEKYPGAPLFFFMGSDNLNSFLKWKNPFVILEMCHVVIYNRNPQPIENELYNHPKVISVPSPYIDISSSQIRKRIEKHMPFKSLVPHAVFEYISQNQVYNK